MKLFALPNLSASAVTQVLPWEERREQPVFRTKEDFVDWCKHPSTNNCHYSAFEGLTPSLRIAPDNEPVFLHGFVVDYDAKVTDDMVQTLNQRNQSEFLPSWFCKTYSGGCRLLWDFEQPLLLGMAEVTRAFLGLAAQKMGFKKIMPGFDEHFSDAQLYYELGRDWQRVSSDQVPSDLLWQWMMQAGAKVNYTKVSGIVIPEAVLAKEVEARFPGRWKGPFTPGTRGPRFWDPGADNPTAAVVRETGMQCFTGDRGFVPWVDILGHSVVEKYQAERTGSVVADWFYDGKLYWRQEGDTWVSSAKEDFKLCLKVQYGLESRAGRKEPFSEIDRVMHEVNQIKRVEAVVPRVHHPAGVYFDNGARFLNNSTVECVTPAECTGLAWGDGFPWLGDFLLDFFEPANQLEYFLGWLKWFYENGYRQAPRSGQAVFIGGDAGVGKTFLTNCVIHHLVGGHQNATSFLVDGNSQFTDHIMRSPLLTVDDAAAASNAKLHARFTHAVKSMVANPDQFYNRKFRDSGQTRWMGRIAVTCNLDPESIRILPQVDVSNLDKVSFFRAATRDTKFLPMGEMDTLVRQEVPYLGRWLIEYQIPDAVQGSNRFGVKSYQEPSMLEASILSEAGNAFCELLDEWRYRVCHIRGESEWRGTSTALLTEFLAQPDMERVSRPFCDTRSVARYMSKLANRADSVVSLARSTRSQIWVIDCRESTLPLHLRPYNLD